MHDAHHSMVEGDNSPLEYIKFGLVATAITVLAYIFYATSGSSGFEAYLRWFMGVFFLVFAGFKFVGYNMFVMMFAGYDIVAKRFKAYAFAYPFIELTLALLYLGDLIPGARDIVTLIVMAVGSIGVFQEISKRSGIHCACLGNIIKLPLSTVSLVEDVGMGLMALVMLIA